MLDFESQRKLIFSFYQGLQLIHRKYAEVLVLYCDVTLVLGGLR